jgi:hypothetical protein
LDKGGGFHVLAARHLFQSSQILQSPVGVVFLCEKEMLDTFFSPAAALIWKMEYVPDMLERR